MQYAIPAKINHANPYIDGLVQDCSNSSVLAMEILQSCTKLLIYSSCSFHPQGAINHIFWGLIQYKDAVLPV